LEEMAHPVLQVHRDLMVHLVTGDPRGSLVQLDQLVLEEHLAHRENEVTRENQAKRDLLDLLAFWVHLDPLDEEEREVKKVR
jgi:hypothetical protein